MIKGSNAIFPNNVVEVIALYAEFIDPDVKVIKRRLYSTDPVQAIGVQAWLWTPDPGSYEMRGPVMSGYPTLQRYDVHLQGMIRDMEESRGMAKHAELTKLLHRLVMGNPDLRASLHGLSSSLYGVVETLKKWSIESTRYLSEEVSGEHIYLSTTIIRLETET